jgi:hypothetical protein
MRMRESAQFNLLERSLHRSQGKGGLYERTGRPSHPPFCKKMLPLGSLLSRDPLPSFPILTPTKIPKPPSIKNPGKPKLSRVFSKTKNRFRSYKRFQHQRSVQALNKRLAFHWFRSFYYPNPVGIRRESGDYQSH